MLNRLKNPLFLTAIAGLVYQVVSKYFNVNQGDYQLVVDVLTYAIIGSGIYSTFDKK